MRTLGWFLIGFCLVGARLPAVAQSSGDILRHIADCEDDYKITHDSSAQLRCMARVEDEIDAQAARESSDRDTGGENSSSGEGYRTHTQDDIDLVIADGNKEAAADQAMLKVLAATGDPEKAAEAKENAERAFGEIEAAQLAKLHMVTGAALDSEMRSVNADLNPIRPFTIDKVDFTDPKQRAAYHTAWHSFSDTQLTTFNNDIQHIWPSVQFAVDHDAGQQYKEELSFLTYAKSDVADEIQRRKPNVAASVQ